MLLRQIIGLGWTSRGEEDMKRNNLVLRARIDAGKLLLFVDIRLEWLTLRVDARLSQWMVASLAALILAIVGAGARLTQLL